MHIKLFFVNIFLFTATHPMNLEIPVLLQRWIKPDELQAHIQPETVNLNKLCQISFNSTGNDVIPPLREKIEKLKQMRAYSLCPGIILIDELLAEKANDFKVKHILKELRKHACSFHLKTIERALALDTFSTLMKQAESNINLKIVLQNFMHEASRKGFFETHQDDTLRKFMLSTKQQTQTRNNLKETPYQNLPTSNLKAIQKFPLFKNDSYFGSERKQVLINLASCGSLEAFHRLIEDTVLIISNMPSARIESNLSDIGQLLNTKEFQNHNTYNLLEVLTDTIKLKNKSLIQYCNFQQSQ